jgi:hypothetical protein
MSTLDHQRTLARALLQEISPEELNLVEPYWQDQELASADKAFATPLEFGSTELFAVATPVVFWLIQQISKLASDQLQVWLKRCIHWNSSQKSHSGHESRDESFDELMLELKSKCSEAGLEEEDFVRVRAALFSVMIKEPKLFISLLV